MKFNELARRAAKGSAPAAYGGALEVEHLIAFARAHGEKGAAELERLSALHGWLDEGQLPDGTRVVPFGRWARVCAAYARAGVPALQAVLAGGEMADMAIGVLESVRTAAAVDALLTYGEACDWRNADAAHPAWKALGALNLLLSFDDGVQAGSTLRQRLQRLVMRAWNDGPTPHGRSLCLYALRGAATPEALAWAQALVLTDPALVAARKLAITTLRRRMGPGYVAPDAVKARQIRQARDRAT